MKKLLKGLLRGKPGAKSLVVAFFHVSGETPMQETALALLAFAETYPEGVWHCLASTGRLTRVISTGAVTSAPRRRRRRLALGSPPKGGSDSALGGVSVVSDIALGRVSGPGQA